MDTYAALVLPMAFMAAILFLVYVGLALYDLRRSRRLDASLAESQQQQGGSLLIPKGTVVTFSEDDEEELAEQVPDVTESRFLVTEFHSSKDQATLLEDLRRIDSRVMTLQLCVENGETYLKPVVSTESVKNPEAAPMPQGAEMVYHLAGHAAAALELNERAYQAEIDGLVEEAKEDLRLQAERAALWGKMDGVIRNLNDENRAHVRLLLDQADADAAADDEAFYQQVAQEEAKKDEGALQYTVKAVYAKPRKRAKIKTVNKKRR